MSDSPSQGPLTILFTDLERSTELYSVRGDDAAANVVGAHTAIVSDQCSRYGGWQIKSLGDGFMLAFASVRAAMACAIGIQRANERHTREHPELAVRVRVGINTGEVTRKQGDVFGQAVNAAARIAGAADPDEILVSRVVKDLTGTVPGIVFVERGSVALKGFPEPWHLYALEWREPAATERLAIRVLGDTSSRPLSLLAYLIVHSEAPQARSAVAAALWPDSSETQARANLRQALHNVRHSLVEPDRFLGVDSRTLQWLPDAPADVDLVAFENAAQQGRASDDRETLERAASLYTGDFLQGSSDVWIDAERTRLRATYAEVLARLTAISETQADYPAGVRFAERLLQVDPLSEASYRRLMRLHVGAGERGRALRVYHACVSALEREHGALPSRETVELYESLIADVRVSGGAQPDQAVAASPLIGREEEWNRLVGCWRTTTAGRAQLVVVTGEAGIGKSRLVGDFRVWCTRSGVSTAAARAYEAEGSLPYGPIIDLLRSDAVRPSLARLDDTWLSEIARVLPELLVEHPELRRTVARGEGERSRLFDSLARAITSTGRPLMIVIDDLQWCDAEALEFLHFVLRSGSSEGLLVVGTARDDEIAANAPVTSLLTGLRTVGAVEEIALTRLDAGDARTLAEELTGRGADEATVRRLVDLSEGNPLFLVEMARSGLARSTSTGAAPAALPSRVQSVIAARLAQLPESARELAGAAAVVGRAFTIELVSRLLSEYSDDDIVGAIDELWRRGIVHERGDDAYDFSHDRTREVAYLGIGPARRHRLHLQAARALEDLNTESLDVVAAQIAMHYDRSGSGDRAVEYYHRAVEAARHVFAHEEVIAQAQRGLELLARRPAGPERDDLELALLVALGVALHSGPGIRPQFRNVYERAAALREKRGLAPEPSTQRILANYGIVRRDFVEAYRLGELLLARGEQTDDALLRAEGRYVLGVSSCWRGALAASSEHLQLALASYDPRQAGEHLGLFGQDARAVCLVRLAFTDWHLGRFDGVEQMSNDALAYAEVLQHPYTVEYVRVFLAWLAVAAGDAKRATDFVGAIPEGEGSWFIAGSRGIFTGWAEALHGDVRAGVSQLDETARSLSATGLLMMEPLALLLLAQAHARAGDPAAALGVATSARDIAQREMQFHEAEAHRLHGELLAACGGEPSEIAASLRRAVDVAHRQGAVVMERGARTSLEHWLEASKREAP